MTTTLLPPDEGDGRSASDWRSTCLSYGMAAAAFALVFLLNWYVVERYFPTPSAAVDRVTAVLASSAYQSRARSQIAVLELNDPYLQWRQAAWPPDYVHYQSILEDVAQYGPRSIFLDIALVHSRSDSGLAGLIETMCNLSGQGIPIYLAALKDGQGGLTLRPELMQEHRTDTGRPCYALVDVTYAPDEGTHLAMTYPLDTGQPSAALAMARDVWTDDCVRQHLREQPGHEDAVRAQCVQTIRAQPLPARMNLTWAMGRHDTDRLYQPWRGCDMQPSLLRELLPLPLRQALAGGQTPTLPCPYHEHVPLRLIADPDSDDDLAMLRRSLEGRHVMVGAVIRGINDRVNTPIQGNIPGVYLHAMALDNLLTDYPQIKSADAPQQSMPLAGWLIASALAWVCFVVHRCGHALLLARPLPPARDAGAGRLRRSWALLLQEAGQLGRWLGFKMLEIACTLFLSGLVFAAFMHTQYSIQALAQVTAVVFGLQWTGVTSKVYDSMRRIVRG